MCAVNKQKAYMDGRCIIIGKPQEVFWLETILEQHFSEIFVVERATDVTNLPRFGRLLLVLSTDTCPGKSQLALLRLIKSKVKPLLTICLLDDIKPNMEVQLRSVGLSFLGSYNTFLKHLEPMLVEAALRLATRKKMDSFHVRPFGMVIP